MKRKTLLVIIGIILICLFLIICIIYNTAINSKFINNPISSELAESETKKDNSQTFYARIEKITDTNNLLVKGLEVNDINYRGEFIFKVANSTYLEWRNTKIHLTDLNIGDNISITFVGGIMETSPASISEVVKIQLLDDEK